MWRTFTVPAPGEPGSETWPKGDQWKTGGGSVWVTGTYDPDTNLAFWGTGNGGPWMGDQRPGDNLYTSSVVALDVQERHDQGSIQYHQNDSWDWDEVSPPILIDYQRGGKTIKGLVDVARDGYLWMLERTDGQINSSPANLRSAQRVQGPRARDRPPDRRSRRTSPAPARRRISARALWGGKDWPPVAYSPKTRMLYIPANENLCGTLIGEAGQICRRPTLHRRDQDALYLRQGADHIGELQAWNLDTGKKVWTHQFRHEPHLGSGAGDGRRRGVHRWHQRPQIPRL